MTHRECTCESVAIYGAGKRCVACDQPITPGQVECDVDLEVNGSHCRLRLHLTCYDIWQLECHKRIRAAQRESGSLWAGEI